MSHSVGTPRRTADVYPDIDGWGRIIYAHGDDNHVGYTTDRANPCPCCGRFPVFEQYVNDVDEKKVRNVPATQFVAICPKCEFKSTKIGTLEEVLLSWNNKEFSEDAIMVRHRLKDLNEIGCERLSNRVVMDAILEAKELVEQHHKLIAKLRDPSNIKDRQVIWHQIELNVGALRKLQRFFETNPIMLDYDAEATISTVRKLVYPDMKIEDRIKIPLRLDKM